MHDQTPESLRKLALKHGSKKPSKKALSKQSSLATSRVNSTANSRNQSAANSRAGSDIASSSQSDEDSRPPSPTSIDILVEDDYVSTTEAWQEQLADTIIELEDRNWKTSSTHTRKMAVVRYISLLRQHCCVEDIRFALTQLTSALIKSVKAEDDTHEAVLALRALAVTIITLPSSDVYEGIVNRLQRTITDSSSLDVKIEAIQTFAIASFYGDISDDELQKNLDFLLEIVSTDGEYIDALDQSRPVAAALEAYGFLATLVDDLSATTSETLDSFIGQLDSSSTVVRIAAGENIALLYEKAYSPLEEDESPESYASSNDLLTVPDRNGGKSVSYYVRRYPLADDQRLLEKRLEQLSSHSSKSISRDAKRSLHSSFADILHSVQHPTHGPRFATTIDPNTGREKGSSMKLKVTSGKKSTATATIDKWWQLHRHRALQAVLGEGFMVHYEVNEAIFEALPIVFVDVGNVSGDKKKSKRKGGSQIYEVELA